MPDMFQRRPRVQAQVLDSLRDVRLVDGKICWADQKALVFGGDAKYARTNRPVYVIRFERELAYVLPATTKRENKWFRVCIEYCVGGGTGLKKDTYLSPRIQTIRKTDIGRFICVLTPFGQAMLVQWLRDILHNVSGHDSGMTLT